jgi:hypothetical protein
VEADRMNASIEIFSLLNLDPSLVKVHLAVESATNPLDAFFNDTFQEWQAYQTRRNFPRQYILSLIQQSSDETWLFAGVYLSKGHEKRTHPSHFYYDTELTEIGSNLIGRLIVSHKRTGRASYRNGETIVGKTGIHSILPQALSFKPFSGYGSFILNRAQLTTLFKTRNSQWKTALSLVSGIYVISDQTTGKLYVGSAYGENGIWGRWSDYARNYHGNNKLLKSLYEEHGPQRFEAMNYSILETFPIDVDDNLIINTEERWKNKLLSISHGYND